LQFSQGNAKARRYPPDVGPFCAVPDDPDTEHFAALRALVSPGGVALLFRGEVDVPNGWDVLATIHGVQMIWPSDSPFEDDDPRIVTLNKEDVDEMMSLTARTKPGPFAPRTVELGTYLGVRIDGQLVAMAGQRARTNDHVEISAVCTDPMFAGQGLGRALMNAQIHVILDEGMTPMLHTSADNDRAIALYEYLGFTHRRDVGGVVMRAPLTFSE
jgi:ribosomal protein S18 acetylase RimI-like enzyme